MGSHKVSAGLRDQNSYACAVLLSEMPESPGLTEQQAQLPWIRVVVGMPNEEPSVYWQLLVLHLGPAICRDQQGEACCYFGQIPVLAALSVTATITVVAKLLTRIFDLSSVPGHKLSAMQECVLLVNFGRHFPSTQATGPWRCRGSGECCSTAATSPASSPMMLQSLEILASCAMLLLCSPGKTANPEPG